MSRVLPGRLQRLFRREGAIRLPLSSSDTADELLSPVAEKAGHALPLVLSAEEAAEEGYTSAHLLTECVGATLWNAACLAYLLSARPSSSPPPAHFTQALLALVAVPLCIGIDAGAACVFGRGEGERKATQERGWVRRAACWLGLVGCIAALWPVGAHLVAGQPRWLKIHLGVTLALIEAILVKAGTDASLTDEDDEDEDAATANEKGGAIALPHTSLDAPGSLDVSEKASLAARIVRCVLRPVTGGGSEGRIRLGQREGDEDAEVLEEVVVDIMNEK